MKGQRLGRLGRGLMLLGAFGGGAHWGRIWGGSAESSHMTLGVVYLGLILVGLLVLALGARAEGVRYWDYRVTLPMGWFAGIILLSMGTTLLTGVALDAARNGTLSDFSATMLSIVLLVSVAGAIVLTWAEVRAQRHENRAMTQRTIRQGEEG